MRRQGWRRGTGYANRGNISRHALGHFCLQGLTHPVGSPTTSPRPLVFLPLPNTSRWSLALKEPTTTLPTPQATCSKDLPSFSFASVTIFAVSCNSFMSAFPDIISFLPSVLCTFPGCFSSLSLVVSGGWHIVTAYLHGVPGDA